MTLFSAFNRLLLAVPIAVLISGCTPLGNSPEDERKDPYFMAGQSRASSMDYDGAITAYENALISNPKSAAAHLEIALLYEEQRKNYAAAIYHFEKHLELQPQSNWAETVQQHIIACKGELSRSVSFALVSRQVQDDMRRLQSTNAMLLDQVKILKTNLIEQALLWSNRLAAATQAAALIQEHALAPQESERRPPNIERAERPGSSPNTEAPPRPAPAPKTYRVQSGDTLALIARRHNIKLTSLMAANPRIDSRKLKAGQVINFPAQRE